MRYIPTAIMTFILAGILSGCGSGPSVLIELEAGPEFESGDTNVLAAVAELELIKDIIERRLEALALPGNVALNEGNRLTVEVSATDAERAREIVGTTGHLEFRWLSMAGEGVRCRSLGLIYIAPFERTNFIVDQDQGVMTCPANAAGNVGVAEWKLATGTDSLGQERALTGEFLMPNATAEGSPPQVLIEFTAEGALLFEQITSRLVGLPLGIFLDDQLLNAPTVQIPIAGGLSTITGLELEEARRLAIILNEGALPLPIRVVSTEEIP